MSDPTRLRDDAKVDKSLRDALDAVARQPAAGFDAHAGLARFDSALAAPPPAVAIKTWLLGGAIGTALVVAGVLSLEAPAPEAPVRVPAVAPPPAVESVVAAEPRVPPVSAPEATAALPSVPLDPATTESELPRKSTAHAPAPPADADARLREEIANLAAARARLDDAPAQALRHAEQGEQRFGAGMFAQERQAIIALSSLRLRRADARARAERFLQEHPHGPLSDRVAAELRQLVEAP